MYHDQGSSRAQIPGLRARCEHYAGPALIRTSVDHGTALELAAWRSRCRQFYYGA
ncbi:4-hydroxythreonine-4-phosphate dehydrogenase PdxA [Escherichia coli]